MVDLTFIKMPTLEEDGYEGREGIVAANDLCELVGLIKEHGTSPTWQSPVNPNIYHALSFGYHDVVHKRNCFLEGTDYLIDWSEDDRAISRYFSPVPTAIQQSNGMKSIFNSLFDDFARLHGEKVFKQEVIYIDFFVYVYKAAATDGAIVPIPNKPHMDLTGIQKGITSITQLYSKGIIPVKQTVFSDGEPVAQVQLGDGDSITINEGSKGIKLTHKVDSPAWMFDPKSGGGEGIRIMIFADVYTLAHPMKYNK